MMLCELRQSKTLVPVRASVSYLSSLSAVNKPPPTVLRCCVQSQSGSQSAFQAVYRLQNLAQRSPFDL